MSHANYLLPWPNSKCQIAITRWLNYIELVLWSLRKTHGEKCTRIILQPAQSLGKALCCGVFDFTFKVKIYAIN
ncbi:hypothetical protein DPEC_G00174580 [Dallia pectoralis]|uniref:Uncharacterized protein n=1 Tax=Dallia pectoralis TaxID=75939 RepID=A0ACC2GE37_DALPE|nr:hypothetical protein DPEC_G00174580 [Dallia pectoralis]